MKSTKAERCTNITFKQKLYCLFVIAEDLIYSEDRYEDIFPLDATFGARQVHDFSCPELALQCNIIYHCIAIEILVQVSM